MGVLLTIISLLEVAGPSIAWGLIDGPLFTALAVVIAAYFGYHGNKIGARKDEKQAVASNELARRDSLWDEMLESLEQQKKTIADLRAELSQCTSKSNKQRTSLYDHEVWDRKMYARLLKHMDEGEPFPPPPPLFHD